jgi:hypothetical protein
LLSQLGIHLILAKQEKIASNSLAKQVDINSNLAYLPSARANIRARTRLAIAISSCMRDSWSRFSHACMTPCRRLIDQEHLEALVGLLFSFCQVQNTKHLERGSFFTLHIILEVGKSQDLLSKI